MNKIGIYLGGLAVLILCILVGYSAWTFKGVLMQKDQETAINKAYDDARQQVATAQKLFQQYQQLSEEHFGKMEAQLTALQQAGAVNSYGITQERKNNPSFYQQALPTSGYALWLSARSNFSGVSASSSSSAVPSPGVAKKPSKPTSAPKAKSPLH
jgi:hypothetical protein